MKGIDDRMFSPTASCLLIEYGEKGWKASYCLENSQLQLLFWYAHSYLPVILVCFQHGFFKWDSVTKPRENLVFIIQVV